MSTVTCYALVTTGLIMGAVIAFAQVLGYMDEFFTIVAYAL